MTRSEFQELVGFLGPKFDAIDGRFESIDRRFESIDRRFDAIDIRFDAVDKRFDVVEDRLSRVEVGVEENRYHIQVLAEGITALDQKMERGFEAQAKLIKGIGARVDRLEVRLA